jgi:DNA-binding MarR family transcriptional regulator
MSRSHVGRAANLVGVLGLAVDGAARRATEEAAGHGAAGPAALVALDGFANGWSLDDLRQVLGLTHSGGVRLVDRLAADGYVERRRGATGREVSVILTDAGRGAASGIRAARARAIKQFLDALTSAERAELTRITEKLLAAAARRRIADRAAGDPPADGWLCRLCDLDACGRLAGRCPVARAASSETGLP